MLWAGGALRTRETCLPNAHWRHATLERVGIATVRPGSLCEATADDGTRCGRPLQPDGTHPGACAAKGMTLRVHTAIRNAHATQMRAAGAFVDVERFIPTLDVTADADDAEQQPHSDDDLEVAERKYKAHRPGIADVALWWPGLACDLSLVDVTIRSPHAKRYYPDGTPLKPGVAAQCGETEKLRKYAGAMFPLALECYGRLGGRSYEYLLGLGLIASDAIRSGMPNAAWADRDGARRGRVVRQWVMHLQGALAFVRADAALVRCGRLWSRAPS